MYLWMDTGRPMTAEETETANEMAVKQDSGHSAGPLQSAFLFMNFFEGRL